MAASAVACSFFFDDEPAGERGMPAQDACALCSKPLARDTDVFMYRGDTPFCTDECRHEQIRLDVVCERHDARRQQRYASGTESRRGQRESRRGQESPGRSPSRADRPERQRDLKNHRFWDAAYARLVFRC